MTTHQSAVEAFLMVSGRVITGIGLIALMGAALLTVLALTLDHRLTKGAIGTLVMAVVLLLAALLAFTGMDHL